MDIASRGGQNADDEQSEPDVIEHRMADGESLRNCSLLLAPDKLDARCQRTDSAHYFGVH